MSDSEKILNDFVVNKNKEVIGEKVVKNQTGDDNYMPEKMAIKVSFTEDSTSKDDKLAATTRRIMNILITIPILVTAVLLFFYVVLKIGPTVITFLRKFFMGLG
jgi:hypothetical protein